MLIKPFRHRRPRVLQERSTYFNERLRDWATWYQANSTRVALFYGAGVLESRWRFFVTMLRGHHELATYIVESLADLWWTRKEAHMPAEIACELDALITAYNANIKIIRDHDKRWEYLLRLEGRFLVLLAKINQDLDRLQQATVLTALGDKDGVVIRAEETYGEQ